MCILSFRTCCTKLGTEKNTEITQIAAPKPAPKPKPKPVREPYLMSNQCTIPIMSPERETTGAMDMDVIPHDDNGNEFDEIPKLPSELIGQKLLYKVKIINIKNIPKNFSANLKVEYQSFYGHSISSTKVYNQKAEFYKWAKEKK